MSSTESCSKQKRKYISQPMKRHAASNWPVQLLITWPVTNCVSPGKKTTPVTISFLLAERQPPPTRPPLCLYWNNHRFSILFWWKASDPARRCTRFILSRESFWRRKSLNFLNLGDSAVHNWYKRFGYYGFELFMSTHQFEMNYFGVFLSILSNASLFTQWITVSFTKAFSLLITAGICARFHTKQCRRTLYRFYNFSCKISWIIFLS